jgi:BirA family transcriptional regulator, biotin operon repressor / biotin---[acetyl-CoA-carboxylase] ligase
MLPLAVPLAICEAAEQLNPDLECKVKWPNDVHVEGRKLAGVLIEARPQDGWAVIGIGLNLSIEPYEFPEELRDRAISLSGVPFPRYAEIRNTAVAAINSRFARWVGAEHDAVLAAWRGRDALRGREIAWEGGSGIADGVDDRGYLLVLTPGGDRIAVGAGEVHLTRF